MRPDHWWWPVSVVAVVLLSLTALGGQGAARSASPVPSVLPTAPSASTPAVSPGAPVAEHATWCDEPGPEHEAWCASLDPALDDAGWCGLLGVAPERCYHAGSARIVLRARVKRAIVVPLRIGERSDADLGGAVWLQYGGHGDAMLTVGLLPQPGASVTTGSGTPPAFDWSVSGIGSGSGDGCAVDLTTDALGVVAGTIRCPRERTDAGKRLRIEVRFRAVPLVAGPLPRPAPPTMPAPTPPPDPVCGLLDGPAIEAATGSAPGSLMLLAAGGQCVALAGDGEVAALSVTAADTAAPLGDGSTWRGAPCTSLPLASPTPLLQAAACAWADGPRFAVGAAADADGSVLVLSLSLPPSAAADAPVPDETVTALVGLLTTALDRRD